MDRNALSLTHIVKALFAKTYSERLIVVAPCEWADVALPAPAL